ncbi:hypothetical protein HPB47_010058 [Ixodes persulcatus]|uniref:Uncharacterized protein n=1 Tax=Ixodes persulcatus TaxID=34615 RepID=A0AC60P074_IXOPE|nr:hypothetical protein HPB47_010058 [Ixodes persulcatus]
MEGGSSEVRDFKLRCMPFYQTAVLEVQKRLPISGPFFHEVRFVQHSTALSYEARKRLPSLPVLQDRYKHSYPVSAMLSKSGECFPRSSQRVRRLSCKPSRQMRSGVRQRDVGRQALNCHGNVAIEAIQGDIGWSTFEAREASRKLTYQGRLLHMDRHRWARRVFDYISVNCVQTQWTRRVNQLRKKYGFFTQPVMETTEANKKSSLQIYSAHKDIIGPEAYYDNSLGSRLLFEARAGALRTRLYRQRFDPAIESVRCGACGQEDETITHLVLHCTGLTPEWDEARRVHNLGRFAHLAAAAAAAAKRDFSVT